MPTKPVSVRPAARAARLVRNGIDDAGDVLGPLKRRGRVVGVTAGQFSLLDLVEAVLDQIAPVSYVLVSTWTPGMGEMERVMELLDVGDIERFQLLVDRSFPGRHPEYVQRVTEICGASAIRMTRTHAKFALIAANEWRICIRTSMNFNTNPRLEQFDLDDDPVIYQLFAAVAEDLFVDVPEGLEATSAEVARGFARISRGKRVRARAD